MKAMIEKIGNSVEEALQAALAELNVSAEDVDVEVLESPSKGFLGFGKKPARIKVTLKKAESISEVKDEKISAEEIISESEVTSDVKNISEVEEEKVPDNEEKFSEVQEDVSAEEKNLPEVEEKVFDKTEVIEKAKKFLNEVFAEMKVEADINVEETGTTVVFDLAGKNLGILIGKHGQTLDALQYLTNLAANRNDSVEKVYFVLDVENYRERRAETLQKLAKSVADRAARMRQDVKLEPMSRQERRIIHTALQNNDRVETRSAGEEPYRYIIVSPKRRIK